MKNTRTRYIPEGATVAYTDANCIVYKYERNGRIIGIAYGGKRSTSDWHFRFDDVADLMRHTKNWADLLADRAARTKTRRAERHTPHTLKVGDILVCSWGYDQTNVDYYQVVALKGKTMISAREIGASYTDGYSNVVPAVNKFVGEAKTYRVNGQNNSIAAYSFASAYPWDGRPDYVTPAGMGH